MMFSVIRNMNYLSKIRFLPPAVVRLTSTSSGQFSKTTIKSPENEALDEEPLKYFGSKAATWQARHTRGPEDEAPWYQSYVISASVATFLIYFCVLREENDIDRKLERPLYEHIEGLEETQLIISYKYNKRNGLPTMDLENRLKELNIDLKELDI